MPCGLPGDVFALLNSRAFYGTVNIEARQARLHHSLKATVATNVPEGEQTLLHSPPETVKIELGSPSIKHARLTLGAPSGTSSSTGSEFVAILPGSVPTNLMTQVQHLLQGAPAQIFLDSNGALTTTRAENKGIVSILDFQIQPGKDKAAVRNIPNTTSSLWVFNRTMAT